jgi:hypothetical protein
MERPDQIKATLFDVCLHTHREMLRSPFLQSLAPIPATGVLDELNHLEQLALRDLERVRKKRKPRSKSYRHTGAQNSDASALRYPQAILCSQAVIAQKRHHHRAGAGLHFQRLEFHAEGHHRRTCDRDMG